MSLKIGIRPRRACSRPHRSGAVVLLGALAIAPAARGEPADTAPRLSNEGRAEQLFHSGERKFDGGEYAGACDDFSESLKLGPKLGTLLNLALCHETVGKLVTAWSEFSHGAAWAAQNNQKDRLDFATLHIRSLEPRLPRIVLQLPPHRAIASLDLDGEPVPEQRWYLPLYLDPGEHNLAVMAPGKKRTTVAFRVIMSPTDQLVMVPTLKDDPNSPAMDRTAGVDATRRALGFAALGIGLVGLAVGATFGVLASAADDRSAIKTDATVATIAFIAGAAFAATGGWLVWTSTSGRIRASIAPQPGGAALGLRAIF